MVKNKLNYERWDDLMVFRNEWSGDWEMTRNDDPCNPHVWKTLLLAHLSRSFSDFRVQLEWHFPWLSQTIKIFLIVSLTETSFFLKSWTQKIFLQKYKVPCSNKFWIFLGPNDVNVVRFLQIYYHRRLVQFFPFFLNSKRFS